MSKQDELWEKAKQHFKQEVAKHLFEYVEGNYSTALMAKELGLSLIDFHQVCLGIAKLWGSKQENLDRFELGESIKNYAAKWFDRGREYGQTKITKDMLTELEEEGNQILDIIPGVEQARKRERLAVVEEIKELCIPLELISSNNKGVVLTFQDIELLKEEK